MVYYAHSLFIYNTSREIRELLFLKKTFDKIINPNGDIVWRGSMRPYLEAVRKSAVLVCSEYKGCVGRGVFDEVMTALRKGIPTFVLRSFLGSVRMKEVAGLIYVSNDDWKIRYGKLKLK